jgi:hypothetical protein
MITGKVVGDQAVLLKFKSYGVLARENLRTAVREQGIRVLALVKAKVSGPVLKNRTGTLRRKLNVQFSETPSSISASVGLSLAYAPPHEYGFDGTVTVKEHLVTITQAFGRELAGPVQFTMPTHERHMKLPERSYLRSTLREETATIRAALQSAVTRSIQ